MAVFYELTTDVFKDRFDRLSRSGPQVSRAGSPSVRRPMRGLEVKEDTHAIIKVIDMMGREIRLADSGNANGNSSSYANFILQSVQEVRSEKSQILETFGDPYLFLFGESARFLDCNAVLLNSQDFNWQGEFWHNYETHLRGTKCAEVGARVYLFYDDIVVEGYMLTASAVIDAQNPMMVPLQFRLFLTNYRNISMIGDPRFPVRAGISVDFAQQYSDAAKGLYTEDGSPTPIRGLIADNTDEWTSTPIPDPQDYMAELEVEDLIQEAVLLAQQNAANMNSVDGIQNAALNNANGGYGSGGSPAKKPANLATGSFNDCRPGSEYRGSDGSLLCTTFGGAQIIVDPNTVLANPLAEQNCPPGTTTPGCPDSPPPANAPMPTYATKVPHTTGRAERRDFTAPGPNSSSAQNPTPTPEPVMSAAPVEPSNSSGAFTSTVIPSCDPSVATC